MIDAARDPEDDKLVVLARATRARVGAEQGAAVRDDTGRTYAAATVALANLRLSALAAAVSAAVASGAGRLEAAAVVGDGDPADDLALLAELGTAVLVVAGPDGSVREDRRLT